MIRQVSRLIIAILAMLALTQAAQAQESWRDDDYGYRMKVTFNAVQDVTGTDENLSQFTVYLYIDPDSTEGHNINSNIRNDFYDMKFYREGSATALNYEAEYRAKNQGTGSDGYEAHLWVEMVSIEGSTGENTDIWCYYGNSDESSDQASSDGSAWDTDGNWAGVWHMNESSWNTTPNEVKNSTGTNHGTAAGNATTTNATNAKIYRCGTFDGTGDYVDCGDIEDIDGAAALTVSVWLKADSFPSFGATVDKMSSQNGMFISWYGAGGNLFLGARIGSNSEDGYTTTTPISTGNWYNVVYWFDGSGADNSERLKCYIDGVEQNLTYRGTIPTTITANDVSFDIGGTDRTGDFDGTIDEVRISSDDRSAAWIKYDYELMDDQTNVTWAAEEVGNTAPILGHTADNVLGACTQDTDGSGNVNIPYRIQDADSNNCTTTGWQYSENGGGAWTDLTGADLSGEDNSKTSATDWSGTEHTIVWASKNQIDDADQDDIQFRFKVNDGTVDSAYGTSASFSVDNSDPTLNAITWRDADSSNTFTEDDTLTFTFSEAMDTSTVTEDNVDTVLAPSSGNYGSSGAKSVSWSNSTTLVVTLGASPTLARSATINPTTAVTDAAGNSDNTSGDGPAFVDPYGVVFDSVTNNPIEGATVTIFTSAGTQCTPGDQIASTDSNPQTTSSTGEYSFLCANGDYYITVSATGYTYPSTKSSFPAGRTVTTGSKGETFTVAGTVLEIDQPLDPGSSILTITKDANKKEVELGDMLAIPKSDPKLIKVAQA